MIRESYVTFEQAKELKELGFPQTNTNKETDYFFLLQPCNCYLTGSKVIITTAEDLVGNGKIIL